MRKRTGNASPLAQVCVASTVNIALDAQAGPSYSLGGSYSSPWTTPHYDWRYQPYFPPPPPPPPHAYTVPFSQCVSPEAPPPMADDTSPFNLHFISGNISKCAGCGNKYTNPLCHLMIFAYSTGSGNPSQQVVCSGQSLHLRITM